jgi:uncharacterized phiE125 gp8 family phage protein
MSTDVGEVVSPPRSLRLTDSTGSPVDADSLPTYAVTLPDGSAGTPPTVLHGVTGEYFVNFVGVQAGLHSDIWAATVGGLAVKFGPDTFHVRATSPAPLVGLAEARKVLGLGLDVSRDDLVREYLEAATELCEDHTGRVYRRQTFVDTYDGGDCSILLRRVPVQSVTTVVESGVTLTNGSGTDWTLDAAAGLLYRGSTQAFLPWRWGRQNIVVTSVAGAPVVSARVRQAVRVTLQHIWSTQGGASGAPRRATGASVDDYAARTSGFSLPHAAEELLGHDMPKGIGF